MALQFPSPFKLEFTLKQHTPLIHFQHDQAGATLRATEVKPKLDRFILTKLGGGDYDAGVAIAGAKKWLIGNGENGNALDYKLSFTAGKRVEDLCGEIEKQYTDRNGRTREDKFPTFFGLMGEENAGTKEFVMHETVNGRINAMDTALVKLLSEQLETFFLKHNFGNRQSKGFGSFYPSLINSKKIDLSGFKYRFMVTLTPANDTLNYTAGKRSEAFREQFELFRIINLFYTALRNGFNQSGGSQQIYMKSILFLYFKQRQHIQWEKKEIKEQFYSEELERQEKAHPNSDAVIYASEKIHLIRDLLGLASESLWLSYAGGDTIKKDSKDVERFKSPLHIKPLKVSAGKYLITFEVNKDYKLMLDKAFIISSKNRRRSFNITTPDIFDFDDFFKFAFNLDLDSLVSYKVGTYSNDLELLKKIFEQVKTNAKL